MIGSLTPRRPAHTNSVSKNGNPRTHWQCVHQTKFQNRQFSKWTTTTV